jgi:MFS family permease
MYTHEEAATIGPVTARSTISWGAIIAALFAMLATTFLLLLLGSAIGFSVADATDLGAIGNGLGIGTVIWIIGTTLVVSLTGGLLAAHLSGRRGHDAGLMHGVVVWAVAILAALIIDNAWRGKSRRHSRLRLGGCRPRRMACAAVSAFMNGLAGRRRKPGAG